MEARITFALIHNFEMERLAYLRPILDLISKNFEAKFIEVHEQRMPVKNDIQFKIRKIRNLLIECRWSYANSSTRGLRLGLRLARGIISAVLTKLSLDNKIKFCIEDMVSRKHLKVLEKFVESDSEFLVVFESDTVVSNLESLHKTLSYIFSSAEQIDFFMISWPYSIKDLLLTEKYTQIERAPGIHSIDLFTTNTLSAYAISQNLASEILAWFNSSMRDLAPPIDWAFNQVFFELNRSNLLPPRTLFANPESATNGSLARIYPSGINW